MSMWHNQDSQISVPPAIWVFSQKFLWDVLVESGLAGGYMKMCFLYSSYRVSQSVFRFEFLWQGTNHWAIIPKRHGIGMPVPAVTSQFQTPWAWASSAHPHWVHSWLLSCSQDLAPWSAAIPVPGPSLHLWRCLPVQNFINNPSSFCALCLCFPSPSGTDACLTDIFWFNTEVLFQIC